MRVDNTRLKPRKIVGELLSKPQETKVVARTTDAFIHAKADTRALEDAQLIQSLVGTVVKTAGEERKENALDNLKQGKTDALLGKDMEVPSGFLQSPEAYAKGYHGIEDEARGVSLKNEYLQVLRENNYFVDSPNAKEQKDSLFTSLYAKYFDEEHLRGNGRDGLLTDGGLALLEEARMVGEGEYQKAFTTKVKQDFTNNAYSILSDTVDKVLDSHVVAPDAISMSMDSIYEEFVATRGRVITKPEYQALMLEKLSQKTLETLRTGDVDRAFEMFENIKELRDIDGKLYERIADQDPVSGQIKFAHRGLIDSLETELNREKVKVEKMKEDERKTLQDEALTTFSLGISELHTIPSPRGRYEKAMVLRDTLHMAIRSGTVYDHEKAHKYLKLVDGLYTDQGYRGESLGSAIVGAEQYVKRSDASFEGLLDNFSHSLSPNDILRFSTRLKENQNVFKSVGEDGVKEAEKYLDDVIGSVRKFLTKGNPLLVGLDDGTAQKVRLLEDMSRDYVYEFIRENNRVPQRFEVRKYISELEKFIDKMVPDPAKEALKGGENGATGRGGESSTPRSSGPFNF